MAIWQHFEPLRFDEIDIPTKGDGVKPIWEKLESTLPIYVLFQADRKNSDGDNEVQNPLAQVVKQILNDEALKKELDAIATKVQSTLQDVVTRTLAKVKEMNLEISNSLHPVIPEAKDLKWESVFKNVSISGDNDIPINKRGSGVKRLILLSFFRAEAERRQNIGKIPSVIYAIEEPETSQHTEHQKKLVDAFLKLSEAKNTQIILTTHSPTVVKKLKHEHLRLIKSVGETKMIEEVQKSRLGYDLTPKSWTVFS